MTHICVGKLTIIGSDNGLAPSWRQVIIWTSACILLIGSLGTNINGILIRIQNSNIFIIKMHLKMSSAKWRPFCIGPHVLTHWGRVTHICVINLTIIGSDNGLSPGRRQAIIWTNAGILLIGPLGTNFNEVLYQNSYIFIQENPFENAVCEMASILYRPPCVKREPDLWNVTPTYATYDFHLTFWNSHGT